MLNFFPHNTVSQSSSLSFQTRDHFARLGVTSFTTKEFQQNLILPSLSFDSYISKNQMFINDNYICYWHGL